MSLAHEPNDPGSIITFKIVFFFFPCLEKKKLSVRSHFCNKRHVQSYNCDYTNTGVSM